MTYRYMLGVMVQGSGQMGFGRADAERDRPITSQKDLQDLERVLPESFGGQNVSVISFSLYADD